MRLSSPPAVGRNVPESGGSTAERYLFIAGCPRSGTSALTFLLNEHPQLAIGFERFKRIRGVVDPFHFSPAQFFAPVTAETDVGGELLYERLARRWDAGAVRVLGDKVPLYTRVLPALLDRFPNGRVVVLVRELHDVAASFNRRAADPDDWWPAENDHRVAVELWNEALIDTRRAQRLGYGDRILLLPYEAFFGADTPELGERWLHTLMRFAGVPVTAGLSAEHERLVSAWRARDPRDRDQDPAVAAHLDHNQDQELVEWARERMRSQLELTAALQSGPLTETETETEIEAATATATAVEAPLSGAELSARERERAQLLEQMRSPGRASPDEPQVLARRYIAQAEQLARCGDRVRRLALTATPGLPRLDARVTFLLPHQRATTGGVYAIEQHARQLAALMGVCVVVRDPRAEPQPIPGVELHAAAELNPQRLPDADVLVYPADMPDAAGVLELPAEKGRPVMFLQGYGTPGSPVVETNLASAREVVAVAHWLVDAAVRSDAACVYVPYGLDRNVFAPGAPEQRRPARLTLMTHRLDWKGLEDALAAVSLVRAARPDVEVVMFGTEPVEGFGAFVSHPSRAQVAELLRTSTVHIASSWEEGFGMPGAEAIACGAALATTDTKGSRDYAIHRRTALVSPPRDPRALADNVLELLDDAGLRERLARDGERHLRRVMPPWPEASRRLALALLEQL
ncbi:MAG TPA: glycosyltransferase [Solirubrobacteraceae bacterium]|nr:glycosyltransferase [Solirubrobacteraceae bacterium]